MGNKIFHYHLVIALCLCLPLSGMSAVGVSCPCPYHPSKGPQTVEASNKNEHARCCPENIPSSPLSPCSCNSSSCGNISETKKTAPDPFLTETTIFAKAEDLEAERVAFNSPDQGFFFESTSFPHQIIYLQIRTLRC